MKKATDSKKKKNYVKKKPVDGLVGRSNSKSKADVKPKSVSSNNKKVNSAKPSAGGKNIQEVTKLKIVISDKDESVGDNDVRNGDFKDEIAASISLGGSKSLGREPIEKLLTVLDNVVEDLSVARDKYLELHGYAYTDDEIPYEVNAAGLCFTYSIHECNKVVTLLKKELDVSIAKENLKNSDK